MTFSTAGPWATGVGSLPFVDEEPLARLIDRFPDVPFLPELPGVDPDDALLRRPFAGLLIPGDGRSATLRIPLDKVPGAAFRIGPAFTFFHAALARGRARGVKLQVAGPGVLGKYVFDPEGRPIGATEEGRAIVRDRIVAFARLQRDLLPRAQLPVLVVIDDPLDGPSEELGRVVDSVRALGASVGVHDCGPGFVHALAARPDVISFDASTYPAEGDAIAGFVASSGAIAWGIVPTTGRAPFDPEGAATRVREAAVRLSGGADAGQELLRRSLVTPACGTALLGIEEAERVHADAVRVARLLRDG